MTDPTRVLVISYLPPAPGGIATWAGILRAEAAGRAVAFEFLEIPVRSGPALVRRIVQTLDAVRLLGRMARRLGGGGVDVVHLNPCLSSAGIWRDLAAALLARMSSVPVVAHYRGSLPDAAMGFGPLSRYAHRRLVDLAAVNVGVTPASVAWLARRSPARTAALPNFVEDRIADETPEIRRPGARPRVVSVGRLSRDKGTFDLLRVAELLPQVDFVLVGEVLEEARVAIDAPPANVRAVGVVSRDEVIAQLRGSDVFVFPSRREGCPNAVIEAMATGLPVVGTLVGGLPEMIAEDEGGWLVTAGDVSALASAVGRLAGDPALASRMGAANRDVCRARYTVSAVFPRLAAVYESVAPRRRPSGGAERAAGSAGQEA